jgi:hypothetical protein
VDDCFRDEPLRQAKAAVELQSLLSEIPQQFQTRRNRDARRSDGAVNF